MMLFRSGQMVMCVTSTVVKIRMRKDTWADGPWGTRTIITVRSWKSLVLAWWCAHETALFQTDPNFSWDQPSVTKLDRNSRVCSGFSRHQTRITKGVNRFRKSDKTRYIITKKTLSWKKCVVYFLFLEGFSIFEFVFNLTKLVLQITAISVRCALCVCKKRKGETQIF